MMWKNLPEAKVFLRLLSSATAASSTMTFALVLLVEATGVDGALDEVAGLRIFEEDDEEPGSG